MKRFTRRFVVNVGFDLLLLVVCIIHLPSVFHRPSAPFEVQANGDRILVSRILDLEASGGIRSGDKLLAWNEMAVPNMEAVEFAADLGTVGQSVHCTIERNGMQREALVTLIPFYSSPRFLIISFLVGFVIWMTAVFILWNTSSGLPANTLHWSMVAFAVTILITLGKITPGSILSAVDRILFFVAYMGVAAFIFFFSTLYPKPKSRRNRLNAVATFLPAAALAAGMSYLQVSDIRSGSLDHAGPFQLLFDVFHISLFVYLGGTVLNIFHSLRTATSREDRKKLQWIVWGIGIGIAPFLLLVVLPQVLLSRYLIPEEYATVFFLAIPFSFSMSFLRYHFLDIEVLINRSIVYAVLSVFTVLAFGIVFLLVTTAFGREAVFEEYAAMALLALGMALLLAPARDWLQHTVDETLFAARANFRAAVKEITEDLHRSLTSETLHQMLVNHLHALIPSQTVASYAVVDRSLQLRAFQGKAVPELIGLGDEMRAVLQRSRLHLSPEAAMGTRDPVDPRLARWLSPTGCSVCCSLTDEEGEVIGVVLVAARLAGERLREEEIDLITSTCAHASEVLNRLTFQERAFLEETEKKKIQELSDLKSYFVSSVSHELRMPLTSIRMFAETLRLGRVSGPKKTKEYLEIIEGESGRLNRLIDNVLDFSRIERGTREYGFGPTDLKAVVRNAAASLQYEFRSVGGTLVVKMPRRLPELFVDADAIEEALMNLLSNALKYSVARKHVTVTVRNVAGTIVIRIADKGIGIPADKLPFVFDKFYRARDPQSDQVGGAGLGLPLVKHIVEAHGGTIAIDSIPGRGTTVTMKLPIAHEDHLGH